MQHRPQTCARELASMGTPVASWLLNTKTQNSKLGRGSCWILNFASYHNLYDLPKFKFGRGRGQNLIVRATNTYLYTNIFLCCGPRSLSCYSTNKRNLRSPDGIGRGLDLQDQPKTCARELASRGSPVASPLLNTKIQNSKLGRSSYWRFEYGGLLLVHI